MARHRLSGNVMDNNNARIYRYFGFSNVCCPDDVRTALEADEDDEIVFELNSGGGSVYAGFEMYGLIASSDKKVTAEIQSIAGSAMSVVAAACDTVLMSAVANIMIHRSSISHTGGNSERLRQHVQMLDTIDESILNAYEKKAGDKSTRTKLRHMMENETFLTGQEAIECGLADGWIDGDGIETNPLDAVADMNAGGAIILYQLPPIDGLKRIMKERNINLTDEGAQEQESVDTDMEEEENEAMENNITTKDELQTAYPELTAEIQQEAASAERTRIAEIDAVALPGYENIVAEAKADPTKNAGSVAMEIIAKQKKQGETYMQKVKEDIKAGCVDEVPGAPTPGEEDEASPEDEAKEFVKLWNAHGKGAKK